MSAEERHLMQEQALTTTGMAEAEKPAEETQPVDMQQSPRRQRVIAVASGKGGVGKTLVTANIGITLTRFGHRVLLVDADFGFGNLDLLLGITPKYNLTHVFSGKKELADVMLAGPSGVRVLPAGSGGKRPPRIEDEQRDKFVEQIHSYEDIADIVLVDTRAGLSDNTMQFLLAADEVILVTSPEPPSIMDSYGVVKILAQERETTTMRLLVNMASDRYDAEHVEETVGLVTRQFFNVTFEQLGWICYDPFVSRAVRQQQPVVMLYPHARATKDIVGIAAKLVGHDIMMPQESGLRAFASRIRHMF